MHPTVGLDLRSNQPLGVIVHNFTVGGDVIQTGGGGGVNCNPQGVFKLFQSPVYSTYEVGSVGGDVRISSVHSCWMGIVQTAGGQHHGDVREQAGGSGRHRDPLQQHHRQPDLPR